MVFYFYSEKILLADNLEEKLEETSALRSLSQGSLQRISRGKPCTRCKNYPSRYNNTYNNGSLTRTDNIPLDFNLFIKKCYLIYIIRKYCFVFLFLLFFLIPIAKMKWDKDDISLDGFTELKIIPLFNDCWVPFLS